jgi:molybdopterin-guanine dinucleotide biosynthesis protein A
VTVTGVIQAGGKSTRMGGTPKALMTLGGRRIIERVLAALEPAVDEILVVTNAPELYAFLGLPMVADVLPDHGSLGGIYTGLRAATGQAALTVACDMPFLVPEVARLVVARAAQGDVVIPRVGAQLETMHALYAKTCLPPMEECLRAGRLKITGFFDRVRVVEISEQDVARWGPRAHHAHPTPRRTSRRPRRRSGDEAIGGPDLQHRRRSTCCPQRAEGGLSPSRPGTGYWPPSPWTITRSRVLLSVSVRIRLRQARRRGVRNGVRGHRRSDPASSLDVGCQLAACRAR